MTRRKRSQSKNRLLTLNECKNNLKQLKRLTKGPRKIVYNFNSRYLELYNQLKAIVRTSFSVINYENALRPRLWMKSNTIKEAYSLIEKYENLLQNVYYNNNNNSYNRNLNGRNERTLFISLSNDYYESNAINNKK
ncbi:hypothetical protein H8356DRAFT_1424489 [Neocallimastix lanati (nom. inval.)]|nr:hypothetical protein H8356DRAFT_1424489 [Neocallimastix sp. JGI-2020a]